MIVGGHPGEGPKVQPSENTMLRRVAKIAATGVAVLVAMLTPGGARADSASDPERVVALVRELFPEVDTQSSRPLEVGRAFARLTAKVSLDVARRRVKTAGETEKRFAAGATVGLPVDRPDTRDVSVVVRGGANAVIGSFVLARQGNSVVIDVFGTKADAATVPDLPVRRFLPEPAMWLFGM